MQELLFEASPPASAGSQALRKWWSRLRVQFRALGPWEKSEEEQLLYLRELAKLQLTARLIAILLEVSQLSVGAQCTKHKIKLQGRYPEVYERNRLLNAFTRNIVPGPASRVYPLNLELPQGVIRGRAAFDEEDVTEEVSPPTVEILDTTKLLAARREACEQAIAEAKQTSRWSQWEAEAKLAALANNTRMSPFAMGSLLYQNPDIVKRYGLADLVAYFIAKSLPVKTGRR